MTWSSWCPDRLQLGFVAIAQIIGKHRAEGPLLSKAGLGQHSLSSPAHPKSTTCQKLPDLEAEGLRAFLVTVALNPWFLGAGC